MCKRSTFDALGQVYFCQVNLRMQTSGMHCNSLTRTLRERWPFGWLICPKKVDISWDLCPSPLSECPIGAFLEVDLGQHKTSTMVFNEVWNPWQAPTLGLRSGRWTFPLRPLGGNPIIALRLWRRATEARAQASHVQGDHGIWHPPMEIHQCPCRLIPATEPLSPSAPSLSLSLSLCAAAAVAGLPDNTVEQRSPTGRQPPTHPLRLSPASSWFCRCSNFPPSLRLAGSSVPQLVRRRRGRSRRKAEEEEEDDGRRKEEEERLKARVWTEGESLNRRRCLFI